MNAKNLWLRFAFVAVLVGLCLLPLLAGRGLRWGIDLRGGHSLVFEFKGSEADRSQMIARLKRRVDPDGLRSLEWRPLRGNRFEVRMPAGTGDAKDKREAYFAAMDRLEENNVQPNEIRDVLQTPADQRPEKVEGYSRGDIEQVRRFKALTDAYDSLQTATAARDAAAQARDAGLKASRKPDEMAKLESALASAANVVADAQVVFDEAGEAVESGNIDRQELHLVLESFFLAKLAQEAKGGKAQQQAPETAKVFSDDLVIKEIQTGQKALQTSLAGFKERYPARAAEIDHVVGLFEEWIKVRQRLDDPSDLIRLIAKAGVLEFRIAPRMPGAPGDPSIKLTEQEYRQYVESLEREGPEGLRSRNAPLQWFPIRGGEREGARRYILLYSKPGNMMLQEKRGAWELTRSEQSSDERGLPAVAFHLDEAGAGRMAKLTAAHQGHPLAILLDDEVYSAPEIKPGAIISSSGIITGVKPEELADLVSTLNAGSLPAKLNPDPVSQNSFGPGIGEVNRDLGYKAALWGLVAVAAFMLGYYLLCGAIADFALLLNIILILGAMSWFGAVFTLPGIAGVVLTIGMAVDANVLIYERLREEQAKGLSVRMAIRVAYERAFPAIFDSNITTLLTCLILGWVGTEEVRGFAITLGLGLTFSLFTALVVTRWTFQILLDLKVVKKSLTMLRLIGVPNIDWMGKAHLFWGFSLIFTVVGIVSLVKEGGDIWGAEFSEGTQIVLSLRDDAMIQDSAGRKVLPNDAVVRDRFKQMAGDLGLDKLQATASVETRLDSGQVSDFIRRYDNPKAPDGRVSLEEWRARGMKADFFAAVDANGDNVLTREELSQKLPPLTYQISTTETNVEKILQVAGGAFGDALEVSTKRDFEMVAGKTAPRLGLSMPAEGGLRITDVVEKQVAASYRNDLAGEAGSALLAVTNIAPPMTSQELTQRMQYMRGQPDYAEHIFTKTKVIGLEPAGEGTFSAFAIIATPAEPSAVERPEAWSAFVRAEGSLTSDALARGSAMPVSNFSAAVAGEMTQLAIVAVVLSWLAIVIYLWFRFGAARWGLAAVICLIHDTVIVVGMVGASAWLSKTALGQVLGIQSFKIDMPMVAAVLTVIGYSVNDTIVVFDRIRENRGKLKTVSTEVINASINQTLSRTLLTSGTVLLVVVIMYVMGGSGLRAFNYALLIGVSFGTYSSIAIAAPMLLVFRRALATRLARPALAD